MEIEERAMAAARTLHVHAHMELRLIRRALFTLQRLQQLGYSTQSDHFDLVDMYLEELLQVNSALAKATLRHLKRGAHQ